MALNISLSSAWSRVTEGIIDNSSSQQKDCVSSSEEVSYGGVQGLTHFTYPISGARKEWALKIWCQGQRACFVPLSFSVCPGVWGCPLPWAAAVGASQDTQQSCTEVTRLLLCHKSSFAEWSDLAQEIFVCWPHHQPAIALPFWEAEARRVSFSERSSNFKISPNCFLILDLCIIL